MLGFFRYEEPNFVQSFLYQIDVSTNVLRPVLSTKIQKGMPEIYWVFFALLRSPGTKEPVHLVISCKIWKNLGKNLISCLGSYLVSFL